MLPFNPDTLTGFINGLAPAVSTTLSLTFSGFVGGFILALALLLAIQWGGDRTAAVVRGYVACVRGTPFLVQLFFAYYGLGLLLVETPAFPLVASPIGVATIALILNSAAHQVVLLHEALGATVAIHRDGAAALGLTPWQRCCAVYARPTLMRTWPLLGNELCGVLKATAVVSLISVNDLMGHAMRVFQTTFDLSVFVWVAIAYLACAAALEVTFDALGKILLRNNGARPSRHEMPRTRPQPTFAKAKSL